MMAICAAIVHPSLSKISTWKGLALVEEAERRSLVAGSEFVAVLHGTTGAAHCRMLLNIDQNQNHNDLGQNLSVDTTTMEITELY